MRNGDWKFNLSKLKHGMAPAVFFKPMQVEHLNRRHITQSHFDKGENKMKTLSHTVMTLFVTTLLLLGVTATSQAAESFSTTRDAESSSQWEGQTDDWVFEDPDGPIEPINPGTNAQFCQVTGKISSLDAPSNPGHSTRVQIKRQDDKRFNFDIKMKTENGYSNAMTLDLIKEAWLHNLTVQLQSWDGLCEQESYYVYKGGNISWVNLKQSSAE